MWVQKNKIINLLGWLIHLIGYTLVLFITSILFKKTIYVDVSSFYIWGFLAIIIIFILNRTVKPLLFWLTLPITGITLGLFYPVINIIILKITDLILFNHFQIKGIFSLFFASIFISVLNALMDKLVVNKVIKGVTK